MRVYIVDDDSSSCRMLARLVASLGHDAQTFTDAAAFLDATQDAYGCVLLDVQMPRLCGLDVLARLAERAPVWPVVMVSGTTDVDDAIAAFRHGALHFLRKPFLRAELAQVLGEAIAVGEARLADQRRSAEAATMRLSPREREVLGALAQGSQSKSIAWQLGVSVRTVDMHRSNILAKLDARNASQAVSIARELKLLDAA